MTKTKAFFICFLGIVFSSYIAVVVGSAILNYLASGSAPIHWSLKANDTLLLFSFVFPVGSIIMYLKILLDIVIMIIGVLILVAPLIVSIALPLIIGKKYGYQFRAYGFYGVLSCYLISPIVLGLFGVI